MAHRGAGRKRGRVLRGALGAGAGEVLGDAAGAARSRGRRFVGRRRLAGAAAHVSVFF